jgi:hypothetical protein
VHAGVAIHVAENLSTTDTDTVDTGEDGILDLLELEASRHVGRETDGVGAVDELESTLEAELEDDTLGGVDI